MLCQCKVIPLKYGSFVRVAVQISARHNLFDSYRSIFFCMKSVVYHGWHFEDADFISCGMFMLTAEYGLVHRGDCINCETCYFCFDPAFVWLVNPLRVFVRVPKLAGDARQWWQLGLCLCSLTEQTNAANSWSATRVSKTLHVVHRYALLVSNSDDDELMLNVLRCHLTY